MASTTAREQVVRAAEEAGFEVVQANIYASAPIRVLFREDHDLVVEFDRAGRVVGGVHHSPSDYRGERPQRHITGTGRKGQCLAVIERHAGARRAREAELELADTILVAEDGTVGADPTGELTTEVAREVRVVLRDPDGLCRDGVVELAQADDHGRWAVRLLGPGGLLLGAGSVRWALLGEPGSLAVPARASGPYPDPSPAQDAPLGDRALAALGHHDHDDVVRHLERLVDVGRVSARAMARRASAVSGNYLTPQERRASILVLADHATELAR